MSRNLGAKLLIGLIANVAIVMKAYPGILSGNLGVVKDAVNPLISNSIGTIKDSGVL